VIENSQQFNYLTGGLPLRGFGGVALAFISISWQRFFGWGINSHSCKPREYNQNRCENEEDPISSVIIIISLVYPIALELFHAPFDNESMK
jgi:hypothetical protein